MGATANHLATRGKHARGHRPHVSESEVNGSRARSNAKMADLPAQYPIGLFAPVGSSRKPRESTK
ncbi:hypothetical protein FHX42_001344 [Saccharopolyspora lacisalsi]|uniref:Uncharacterized protein n=1 Tax=Halosaccharopolyspora lacisalsi TaxID=1000566 RepID=A0A839DXC8_9PSEU|nr:hypothetical protein [Halosaccharopolyspora lacisalsi]